MACAACEAAQHSGASYFVRVGAGNVEVRGCRDHVAMLIACWRWAGHAVTQMRLSRALAGEMLSEDLGEILRQAHTDPKRIGREGA